MNVCGRAHSVSDSWVMDSGAIHHMTSSKESFISLCSTYNFSIEVDDSSHIYVKGKGDIPFEGCRILDVLLVPNI